jgi:ABC-type sugar transport system permease subunit
MSGNRLRRAEARHAWLLIAPALAAIAAITAVPLAWTIWESLHQHDLRMPWLGRPFVGLANYVEAAADARFRAAAAHAAFFTVTSVGIELVLGVALALAMNAAWRGRAALRVAALLPWAVPTVVAALVWRFLFDDHSGLATPALAAMKIVPGDFVWLAHSRAAWVPIVAADVWRMTPFVALLILSGLQQIDEGLYEAARMDGATRWQQFREITLPLLKPAILVAVLFRALDAFRVFDLVYVLTGGGPGTATEPISLYAFSALLQNLRFGYGSALATTVFAVTFVLALMYVRLSRAALLGDER